MIENFKIDGWTLFSQRRNSLSYFSSDKKWVLKTSGKEGEMTLERCLKNYETTKYLSQLGVPTPEVKDVIRLENGQYGIIYQCIPDKKSLSRAMAEDPSLIAPYMTRFAKMAKKLHSIKADSKSKILIDYKTELKDLLLQNKIYRTDQKDALLEILENTENSDFCVHGDLNPSNVIIGNNEAYFIDLDTFGYGSPMFDLCFFAALTTSECKFDRAGTNIFKCPKEQYMTYWDYFAVEYFGTTDKDELQRKKVLIIPYMFLLSLLFNKTMGGSGKKVNIDNAEFRIDPALERYRAVKNL